jgi:hypothetical protein
MKGAEKVMTEFILALTIIGGFIVLILFFMNYYVQTNSVIKASDVDRHSTVLGNLFLSSDKLAYTIGKTLNRDIFSKEKLDKEMINQNNLFSYTKIFSDSVIFKDISFPNSIVVLYIQDAESSHSWFLIGHGSLWQNGFDYFSYETCLMTKLKLDPQTVGRIFTYTTGFSGPFPLWDQYDFKECESSYTAQVGTSLKTFPVAIRFSDTEVHEGILWVWLREI